ncbi:MAG: SRPBCC domain-containing protein [Nocardioidaceae bacterium]|nr:SRPBCC domain-containing protein [Nocardioidaceae bacterium]
MSRADIASLVVPASPTAAYAALVDPDALVAWLPPTGMTATLRDFDGRVGGGYRMTLTYREEDGAGKTTADSDEVAVHFTVLVPGVRVVEEVDFTSEDPAFAGTMTMTWTLDPVEGGTEVVVRAENVPPGIDPADHQTGLSESLAGLAAYLAAIS